MEKSGLYIQVPFCASKCSFCNFSSRVERLSVFDAYASALAREINRLPETYESEGISRELLSLPVDTVYLGGGTPTLLGAARLKRILQSLRRRFQFWETLEFTLEATPGSADGDFLASARALGVNRLSVGAQSFDDRELRAVGRLHTADDTRRMVRRALRAGIRNINLDLIAGLPFQTEASWRASLGSALELEPAHLSVYLFEVDEKSRLGAEILREGARYHAGAVPSEDFMAEAYETARQILAKAGYAQYEISNFALPGFASRHNRKYWQLEPYVGVGAGAHSFDGVRRWANETEVKLYEEKLARGISPIAEIRSLSRDEQIEEFFFLGLRQREGVDLAVARARWGGARLGRWEPKISVLAREGWLEKRAERVSMTDRAYLVSNEIFQEFLTV